MSGRPPWSRRQPKTKVTVDLGTINYTIGAGRALRVKLTVDASSGDAVMFA